MTREEAIQVLKRTIAYDSDFAEAKQMAISALSAEHKHCWDCKHYEPKYNVCHAPEVVKQVTSKLNNPCDSLLTDDSAECKEKKSKLDLISRADAIEAVRKKLQDWGSYAFEDYRRGLYEAQDIIEAIPAIEALSAEPSDLISRADAIEAVLGLTQLNGRVPTDSVIFQIKALPSADRPSGEWIPCSERLPSESGDYLCTIPLDADETYTEVLTFHKGRFYEDDDEWGATYHDDVVAWQPLPKPYECGARMKGGAE